MSWSSGGEQIVYVDGEKIGSASASTENLTMGGEISIGNAKSSKASQYTFGGQLFKLNLYSEVLSPTEIRDMSKAGICSSIEKKYKSRKLTWKRILSEPRHGNVTEFIPDECYNRTIGYFKEKLNKTEFLLEKTEEKLLDREQKLNQTEIKLNETLSKLEVARKIEDISRWDVLFTYPYLNKLFTRKLYNQLVGNWNMMGKYLTLLIIF